MAITVHPGTGTEPDGILHIDCAECALDGTQACADCVVSFVLDPSPRRGLVVDPDEMEALRALERGGLVPGLRHRRRTP